jgi:6-phosphogluconolactonase (cycloisomerase 2 family)
MRLLKRERIEFDVTDRFTRLFLSGQPCGRTGHQGKPPVRVDAGEGAATQPVSSRFVGLLLCLAFLLGGCNSVGVTKTTPTINWATPSAITYGTPLSATQLNATTSVTGSFAYTPPASTVLTSGTQTLSVTFTPSDSIKYTNATKTVSLTVNKATPTINWPAPAAITFGTALSATQLDATASVPGTFVYTPPASTVLNVGTQTLSVLFTPTDSVNYNTVPGTVSITVSAAVGGGIGPAGGTVNGFYGASVTIPAGALATTVDIEIPRDSTGSPALPPTGIDTAGAMYALTPHGTPFSLPATVQIPFDSTRIPTDATPVIYKGEPGGAFAPIATTVNGNFLTADVSNFSWVLPGYAATLPRMVYALTRADVNGTSTVSVSSFKITKGTGDLSAATSSAPVGTGAISVTVHPSRRFLYVSNGSGFAHGTAANVPANSISVYQLDPVTGAISGPTDTQPVNGNPVSVVVHPTGKFIYVVNEVRFGSAIGNISAFSIDNVTGALTPQGTVADLGGTPATSLAFPPSGEFAYVTYLPGGPQNPGDFDTVKTYGVSPTSGRFTTTPIGSAPTGDNPWALVVTPGGHFAYVASLSAQGNVDQIAVYSINQTTGLLTVQSSFGISPASGQSPLSLAMDPEARFLYVGLQSLVFAPPNSNFNVHTYNINPNNGSLSFAAGLATSSNPQGPISVIAEPQAQFLYVMDANGQVGAFKIGSNGVLTPQGNPITSVFLGGNSGGVGDPFFFAASGTSPVWQDNCTVIVSGPYIFDGCPTSFLSTGPGSTGTGGTGTGNPPPPAAMFTLDVSADVTGGFVVSSPAGINLNTLIGPESVQQGFPNGTTVFLTAAPPDNFNVYDVKWTGSCSGTTLTASVTMTQDQGCHVTFTPTSQR